MCKTPPPDSEKTLQDLQHFFGLWNFSNQAERERVYLDPDYSLFFKQLDFKDEHGP